MVEIKIVDGTSVLVEEKTGRVLLQDKLPAHVKFQLSIYTAIMNGTLKTYLPELTEKEKNEVLRSFHDYEKGIYLKRLTFYKALFGCERKRYHVLKEEIDKRVLVARMKKLMKLQEEARIYQESGHE